MFKKTILLSLLIQSQLMAKDHTVLVSMGKDLYTTWKKFHGQATLIDTIKSSSQPAVLVKMNEDDLDALGAMSHNYFSRCGGFMVEEDTKEAKAFINNLIAGKPETKYVSASFAKKADGKSQLIKSIIEKIKEDEIKTTIDKLSSFQNRYYKSKFGTESQNWVMETWQTMAKNRDDITIEKFAHTKFSQPSIILTIKGSTKPEEIVILGGHGDSTSGWSPSNNVRAPGADDNASGIATITEVLRVLMDNGYRPARTIKLMAYAAEEAGLLGSKDIAKAFKKDKKNVVGVIQLDMTNFVDPEYDIVFMTDNTNAKMTDNLATIAKTYLPDVRVGKDQCGYACSDHASWDREGYPAAIPFETRTKEMNPHIHTEEDVIDQAGGNAEHAVPFAKLVLAYLIQES